MKKEDVIEGSLYLLKPNYTEGIIVKVVECRSMVLIECDSLVKNVTYSVDDLNSGAGHLWEYKTKKDKYYGYYRAKQLEKRLIKDTKIARKLNPDFEVYKDGWIQV